jgi:N-acyl-phosphatidylethanolamine-hydrolysing phospholipase D
MDDKKPLNFYFKWIGSATWVMRINELKIACDPVLCPKNTVQHYAPGFNTIRLTDPVFEEDDFKNIDIWLISHEHEDHLDKYGLAKVDPETIIVANRKAEKIFNEIRPKKLYLVKYNQILSYQLKGLSVEIKVMPTVHASNPLMAYFLSGGNGYWLTIKNKDAQLPIYVTGDTVKHEKVMNAIRGLKADILIPNMGDAWRNYFGGPLTFSIKTLQPVIDTIKPEIILPVHFASFAHFPETSSTIKAWNNEKVKIFTEGDCFQM